jgi:hypothetical protein
MIKIKHIWIEKLTVIKFLWALSQSKKTQIFYTSSSSLVDIIIRFFPIAKFIQPEKGISDINGRAMIYETEKGTYKYVLEMYNLLSLSQYLPNGMKLFQDEWQRIFKSHLDSLIKKKLITIFFIKQQYENNSLDKVDKISFIGESFMFDDIFYKLLNEDVPNVNFITWPDISAWFSRIVQLLKFFALVVYSWCYKFFRYDYKNKKKKAHIFEEHIFNIFDRYPEAGHLFWFESSEIDPKDLVLYFDRADLKINRKLTKEIDDRRMRSVNMTHPVIHVDHPFKLLINTFKAVKWFKSFSYQEVDIWLTQIKYFFLINCFRETFRKYRCKIIHQHQEFWPNTLVMALAIRMEKGVFVWNHWSVDHFPVSYFHWGFADIVFSWGKYNDGYFNCHDFSYKYLFQTGLIAGDGNLNINNEKEKEKEKKFSQRLSSDLNLVVNILDSTYGITNQNSFYSMIYFYKEILSKIYNHKSWGATIKSKGKAFEKIIYNKEIAYYVNLLKNENRLVILPSDLKVSTSANISDISVCYGINSAGVIAALSGSKSIYWDLPGTLEHPLYYLEKKDSLIFSTIDEIVQALEKFVLGNQKIGDHDDCLSLFDTFRDDQGQKRVGKIMSRLFSDLKNNLDLEESFNKIKKEYEDEWGKKLVYAFGEGDDHKGNYLWHQVQKNIKK